MNILKKTILFIFFLPIVAFNQNADKNNIDEVTKFAELFIDNLKSQDFNEAYLMLSESERESESEAEFKLFFKSIKEYYGKIISYKSLVENRKSENLVFLYEIEFAKTEATLYFKCQRDEERAITIGSYMLMRNGNPELVVFNEMAEVALKHLANENYKDLYDLMRNNHSYISYEEFETEIKKLEIDGQVVYKQKRDNISVYNNVLLVEIIYEINGIGDIIFSYEKEEKQTELSDIRFYHTKIEEGIYNENLSIFIDTTSLLKNKEVLSAKDSLFIKEKFDEIQHEIIMAELQEISDLSSLSAVKNDLILGTSYDWDQLEEKEQSLIKASSEVYLKKLAENDIKGFWEASHAMFKASTPFVAFSEVGLIIANMITSTENFKFIDAKKVTYSTVPETGRFSTGGSLDKTNPTYLQFYTIGGIQNQSLSLYDYKNNPLSKTISMKFGLEDGTYKLVSIEINTNSIENKDAEYYSKIARKWESFESMLPRFIALNMAYRLSYLGKGTVTSRMIDLTEELQTLHKNTELISEIKIWHVNDSIYDIINIDFLETQSDITPNILYIKG